ncbi:23179_t:CDS:2, partial [Racocetra persica]
DFEKVDGIATSISNGFIKSPRDGYDLKSYVAFAAIGGQYVIVYLVVNDKTNINDDYRYPHLAIYAHLVKEGLDPLSEQFLLHESYNRSILLPTIINCQAGFNSLKLQSNICSWHYFSAVIYPIQLIDVTEFIKFSSSGSIIHKDIISKSDTHAFENHSIFMINQTIIPLPYGGSITFNISSIPDANNLRGSLQIYSSLDTLSNPHQIFEANYDHFENDYNHLESYGIFDNNTLWFVYGNASYNRKLITIDVDRIYTDFGYENAVILSSYPELDMLIPVLFDDNINIYLFSSIVPSSGNISIYQIIDQDTLLLRQIYPASSHCLVYNSTILSCQTLSSTFNRINSNYTIIVNDNFVTSLFNEPLRGIKKGVWNVMTSKNPSDFSKLLIEFSINKATDPLNEPSVNDIVKDLDIMIRNKYISALSDKKFMIFLDEQYGFQVKPNLLTEIKYKLLALAIIAFVLFVVYLLARWRYPKGKNFIIIKLSMMILDLLLDCLFIIENGHDISYLFIPRHVKF